MIRFGTELLSSAVGLSVQAGALALAALIAANAYAQDTKTPPSSPVGGAWESNVNTSQDNVNLQALSPVQQNAINVVNDYFNAMNNLQGRFVQIDPDQKETKGTFYVQKPGKFRFDYSAPSRKVIVSDGQLMAIQDLDLRNEDVYELDSTPFRLLLNANVDIFKDARVLEISADATQVAVTMADKDPESIGQITIIMGLQPQATLLGWITADGQGQKTNVTVSDVSKPEKLDTKLFRRKRFFQDATNPTSQ